jgi:hypothetical protein
MERSLTLTIIAIFQGIVSGLSWAVGGLLIVLMTGKAQVWHHDLIQLTFSAKALVVLEWGLSAGGLVATSGLWRLQPWGWVGSVGFQTLCTFHAGWNAIALPLLSPRTWLAAGLHGAVVMMLLRPGVRAKCWPLPSVRVTEPK